MKGLTVSGDFPFAVNSFLTNSFMHFVPCFKTTNIGGSKVMKRRSDLHAHSCFCNEETGIFQPFGNKFTDRYRYRMFRRYNFYPKVGLNGSTVGITDPDPHLLCGLDPPLTMLPYIVRKFSLRIGHHSKKC